MHSIVSATSRRTGEREQKMKNPNGYVFYRGPSLLDGKPIVGIALTHSTNSKTGDMVQTYILRDDIEPHTALKTGDDVSVCGDCKHRPANGGSCYVLVFQGPLVVFRAMQRGSYPDATPAQVGELVAGRMVRLGTYGDPAAIPANAWEALTAHAAGRTGYSHQWRNENLSADQRTRIARLTMASVDSMAEQAIAHASGLRYFRIRSADEPLQAREFVCPASHEGGKKKTCAECGACDGSARSGKASPVIIVHGSRSGNFARQRATV